MSVKIECDKCGCVIETLEECFVIGDTEEDKAKLIIGEAVSHLRVAEMFKGRLGLCLTCKNELEELEAKLKASKKETVLAFFEKQEESEDLEDDGLEDENTDDETVEMLDLYFIVTKNGDDEPYSYKYPISKDVYAEWVELDVALEELTKLEQAIFEALHTENENVLTVKFDDDLTFPIIEHVDLYFNVSVDGIDDFQYKHPMAENDYEEMLNSEDFETKMKELEQSIFDELAIEYLTIVSVSFDLDLTIENMSKDETEDLEDEQIEDEAIAFYFDVCFENEEENYTYVHYLNKYAYEELVELGTFEEKIAELEQTIFDNHIAAGKSVKSVVFNNDLTFGDTTTESNTDTESIEPTDEIEPTEQGE